MLNWVEHKKSFITSGPVNDNYTCDIVPSRKLHILIVPNNSWSYLTINGGMQTYSEYLWFWNYELMQYKLVPIVIKFKDY